MQKKLLYFSSLLTLAWLFLSAERPREVVSDHYSGYIFAKHAYIRSKFFIPTISEIHEAETTLDAKIVAVLASDFDHSEKSLVKKQKIAEQLRSYKRRYFGIINTVKKKILFIEFVHEELITGDEWKHPKWSIDGGGHQFWTIRFNISSGLFYDLWINEDVEIKTAKKKRKVKRKSTVQSASSP